MRNLEGIPSGARNQTVISLIAPDWSENKVKRYFKQLCHEEGNNTSGFNTNYEFYARECSDALNQLKERVEAPPIEESGVVVMESPANPTTPEFDSFIASMTDGAIVPILQSMVDEFAVNKIDRGATVQYDLSPELKETHSDSDVWIIEPNSDSKEADRNLLYTLQKDKDLIASQYGISQIFISPKDPDRIYAIFQSLGDFAWTKFCMHLNSIEKRNYH